MGLRNVFITSSHKFFSYSSILPDCDLLYCSYLVYKLYICLFPNIPRSSEFNALSPSLSHANLSLLFPGHVLHNAVPTFFLRCFLMAQSLPEFQNLVLSLHRTCHYSTPSSLNTCFWSCFFVNAIIPSSYFQADIAHASNTFFSVLPP